MDKLALIKNAQKSFLDRKVKGSKDSLWELNLWKMGKKKVGAQVRTKRILKYQNRFLEIYVSFGRNIKPTSKIKVSTKSWAQQSLIFQSHLARGYWLLENVKQKRNMFANISAIVNDLRILLSPYPHY